MDLDRKKHIPEWEKQVPKDHIEEKDDSENPTLSSDHHLSNRTRLIIVICLLIGITGTVAWLLYSEYENALQSAELKNSSEEIEKGPPLFSRHPKEIAEAFVNATNPQERLRWVRNPNEVEKHLAQYSKQALSVPVEKLISKGIANSHDLTFSRFHCSLC